MKGTNTNAPLVSTYGLNAMYFKNMWRGAQYTPSASSGSSAGIVVLCVCVVRVLQLKLTIICTWKFVIKSNTCILFVRLNSNYIFSITWG
jgi:hypothetical protein